MNIKKIFESVEYSVLQLCEESGFKEISYNSKEIKEGDIFVALKGFNVDGHNYIFSAIQNGAKMIMVEREDLILPQGITVIYVKNLRHNLGKIASNFYNHPEKKLKILAVTGTNGKTTTTYILESVLKNSSRIGTTGYRIGNEIIEAKNTTPESLDIIKLMKKSVDLGIEYFIMEVSSHALYQGRVDMLEFDGAIFTNLTQDHLDFHNNMEEYFNAKSLILNHLKDNVKLIVNKDNKYCKRLLNNNLSFSLNDDADIIGEVIDYEIDGMKVKIKYDNREYEFITKLMGRYNLQNILASVLLLINLGYNVDEIIEKISKIESISGRFELIENDKSVMVVVDYAHSPDGLENILKTLNEMKKNKIVTLFGAGGDRDKSKRSLMANVVSKYSDYIFITSDNPRSENPIDIINEIEKGIENNVKYDKIENREIAIKKAISMLDENDILLIAGKGHEDYQILGNKKIHFDDREMARKYLGGI